MLGPTNALGHDSTQRGDRARHCRSQKTLAIRAATAVCPPRASPPAGPHREQAPATETAQWVAPGMTDARMCSAGTRSQVQGPTQYRAVCNAHRWGGTGRRRGDHRLQLVPRRSGAAAGRRSLVLGRLPARRRRRVRLHLFQAELDDLSTGCQAPGCQVLFAWNAS